MRKLVSRLLVQSKKATPRQLAQVVDRAGAAPFAGDLLEVNEPLWGGFWQGDVIAPGYRLPAVELALLRAARLDATWPEGTSIPQFLAHLRQAILDPQAGIWALAVVGEPCVVFASTTGWGSEAGGVPVATVAWYCTTTGQLHAGYRATTDQLNFPGAVEQRQLQDSETTHLRSASALKWAPETPWLEQVLDQHSHIGDRPSAGGGHILAVRLDAEILQLRAQMRK